MIYTETIRGHVCTFDDLKHRYRIDGVLTKGVTTVLGVLHKYLEAWAARTATEFISNNILWEEGKVYIQWKDRKKEYHRLELSPENAGNIFKYAKEAPNEERDEAARQGKLTHSYLERWFRGERDFKIDPICKPSWIAFQKWEAKYKPEAKFIEKRLFSFTKHFAGTVDFIGTILLNNQRPEFIIDWKTSGDSLDKGIYPDTQTGQLGGYDYAYADMFDCKLIPGIGILHLPKSIEDYGWHDFSHKRDAGIKLFMNCLEIYELKKILNQGGKYVRKNRITETDLRYKGKRGLIKDALARANSGGESDELPGGF